MSRCHRHRYWTHPVTSHRGRAYDRLRRSTNACPEEGRGGDGGISYRVDWDFIGNYSTREGLLATGEPFSPTWCPRGRPVVPSGVGDQHLSLPPDPIRRSGQPLNVKDRPDHHLEV